MLVKQRIGEDLYLEDTETRDVLISKYIGRITSRVEIASVASKWHSVEEIRMFRKHNIFIESFSGMSRHSCTIYVCEDEESFDDLIKGRIVYKVHLAFEAKYGKYDSENEEHRQMISHAISEQAHKLKAKY